jgi:hypothetical protein
MRFARRVFSIATLFGLAVIPPMFFLEGRFGRDYPPPITHPEFYYGFVGAVFAWQLVYLLVAWDPLRYRPLMLLGAVCKMSFATATFILVAQGSAPAGPATLVTVDVVLSVLFVWAFVVTGRESRED